MSKLEEQVPVKVVDGVMGCGKSTAMFKLMGDGHKDRDGSKRYMYVSIFNDEVGDGNSGVEGRVHHELPDLNFKMPKNRGYGKKGDIKSLLKKGCNISTTHASFSDFDIDAIRLMLDGDYTLVIDEAIDCITKYGGLSQDDLNILKRAGSVEVEEDGKLIWCGDKVGKGSVNYDTMVLCDTESLYYYRDNIIMWEYPPLLLRSLPDVYVVTYLFEGSIMSSWMKKNKIEYKFLPANVLGLRDEDEIKANIRDKLEILKSNGLNKLRGSKVNNEYMFSSSWYKRNKENEDVMDSIVNIFSSTVNRTKTKSREVFWTTFKDYKGRLQGKGYKQTPKDGLPPFLPYNKRAINDYRDHTLCLYGVDVHKTPMEVNYLADRGINFDTNLYSLSEMVQFIFRGSIRKGEHMKILVLSDRMEGLLRGWLYE